MDNLRLLRYARKDGNNNDIKDVLNKLVLVLTE